MSRRIPRPVWRRSSAYDPIVPSPMRAGACVDLNAEGERLALAGVHPRDISDDRLRGAVGRERGGLAEERVVAILLDPERRPWWLSQAVRGSAVDDLLGIDIRVITHDAGTLFLQIKSSFQRAANFRRSHNPEQIGIVVAPLEADPDLVWGRAMGTLIRLRENAFETLEAL